MTGRKTIYRTERCRLWFQRHPLALLLGGYGLLAALFSIELLLPGRSLYRWDTVFYNWPVLLETRAQLLAGHFPFWASSFCCGTPLLENINAGVLYPLRLPCWILPLPFGYHLFLLLHVWLSLVGMHLLLKRGFRLPLLAAFAGALAYAFSGYARGMWDTHNFMALPWIPLTLAVLLEARKNRRFLFALLGTALGWSMLVLCGDFQAAVLWVPVAFLLGVILPERRRLLVVLVAALGLGMLLTAPQWLPAWTASTESYRAGGLTFSESVERSFHPLRLVELLAPYAFGTRAYWMGAGLAGEGASRLLPWTTSFHVGLFPLLTLPLVFRKRKRPVVRWALLVTVASVAFSFGRFLPGFRLWQSLPVLENFRYPEKYLLWSTFALAVLLAHGLPTLCAMWRSQALTRLLKRTVRVWTGAIALATLLILVVMLGVVVSRSPVADAWAIARVGSVLLLVAGVWVAASGKARSHWRVTVPLLCILDVALWWCVERPTTARFNPLDPPAIAQIVHASDAPFGRFLRDRAVENVPLGEGFADLSHPEQRAEFYRAGLAFNSPRLWGMSTAEGFSPTESKAMRAFRLRTAAPDDDTVPSTPDLARFCRVADVSWLLTTRERVKELQHEDLAVAEEADWNSGKEVLLVRVEDARGAEIVQAADHDGSATLPRVLGEWRPRPGLIRIDLAKGTAATLLVKESFAKGWRALDGLGRPLRTKTVEAAFIGVELPEGTSQVRLTYQPVAWTAAGVMGGVGLCALVMLGVVLLGRERAHCLVKSPVSMAVIAVVLYVGVGVLARGQWACTFDEGFHVTRGVMRSATGDARLSYYHPPLQNAVGGYFARLALGEKLYLPDTPGWQAADVFMYSTELATANRDLFPDLVQASRWGTVVFGILLCVVCVTWGWRVGGVTGGWLAALAISLNPTVLAHGHLTTSDMGVTALVLAGSYALWRGTRDRPSFWITCATLFFVLGAMAKFTGLVWLLTYLLVCVPALVFLDKRPRYLWQFVLAILFFALSLFWLYGSEPQLVRTMTDRWWSGRSIPAGRYIEGLFSQGRHALQGQRSFFAGKTFTQSQWWYLPVAVAMKTPVLWMIAGLAGLFPFLRRRRELRSWVPWVPALVFAVLLVTTNRLAIGVRHALPLVVLLLLGAVVWASELRVQRFRRAVVCILAGSVVVTAALTYPHYLSYMTGWSGGLARGYEQLVDSNYDWGQDIEVLERQWAALTEANGGEPPHLAYFGFVDPEVIYRMPLASPSLRGHMGRTRTLTAGPEAFQALRAALETLNGTVVCSVSALALQPYGISLEWLRGEKAVGRLGNCFAVYHSDGPEPEQTVKPDEDQSHTR